MKVVSNIEKDYLIDKVNDNFRPDIFEQKMQEIDIAEINNLIPVIMVSTQPK